MLRLLDLQAVFHFLPIMNPDGYTFSRKKSPAKARDWCKNRRNTGSAHGVDLERNFGVQDVSWGFGKTGKAGAKRDDYQGASPLSEPETRAVADYVRHYTAGVKGRVAVLHVRCCKPVRPQIVALRQL